MPPGFRRLDRPPPPGFRRPSPPTGGEQQPSTGRGLSRGAIARIACRAPRREPAVTLGQQRNHAREPSRRPGCLRPCPTKRARSRRPGPPQRQVQLRPRHEVHRLVPPGFRWRDLCPSAGASGLTLARSPPALRRILGLVGPNGPAATRGACSSSSRTNRREELRRPRHEAQHLVPPGFRWRDRPGGRPHLQREVLPRPRREELGHAPPGFRWRDRSSSCPRPGPDRPGPPGQAADRLRSVRAGSSRGARPPVPRAQRGGREPPLAHAMRPPFRELAPSTELAPKRLDMRDLFKAEKTMRLLKHPMVVPKESLFLQGPQREPKRGQAGVIRRRMARGPEDHLPGKTGREGQRCPRSHPLIPGRP